MRARTHSPLTQAAGRRCELACQNQPRNSSGLLPLFPSFIYIPPSLQFRFPERKESLGLIRESKTALTWLFLPSLHFACREVLCIERKQKPSPSAGREPRGGQVHAHITLLTVGKDVADLINLSDSRALCSSFFLYRLPSPLPLRLRLTRSERNQYIFHS